MELESTPTHRWSWRGKALAAVTILAITLGGFWWWYNRPIQPVELSAQEKSAVKAKVEAIQKPAEPNYEKGAKEIILTERELNGLLNENTDFGKSISLQLVTNAIHARVETDLDPDLPFIGRQAPKSSRAIPRRGRSRPPESYPRRLDGLGHFPAQRLARRAQGPRLAR